MRGESEQPKGQTPGESSDTGDVQPSDQPQSGGNEDSIIISGDEGSPGWQEREIGGDPDPPSGDEGAGGW